MIPKHLKAAELIGRKCRPISAIRNGAGDGITEKTVCIIDDVVRGHGFDVKTTPCPHCGQYAYIRGVKRSELILLEDEYVSD